MLWCFEFYTRAIFCHCCHWGEKMSSISSAFFSYFSLCACDAIAVMKTTLVTTQKFRYVATIVFCFYFHNSSHINLVNCTVVKLTSQFRPYLQNIKEKKMKGNHIVICIIVILPQIQLWTVLNRHKLLYKNDHINKEQKCNRKQKYTTHLFYWFTFIIIIHLGLFLWFSFF